MANLTQAMRKRAQQTADQTGKPRYIVYTSLGWRIERAPSKAHENLMETFKPRKKEPKRDREIDNGLPAENGR